MQETQETDYKNTLNTKFCVLINTYNEKILNVHTDQYCLLLIPCFFQKLIFNFKGTIDKGKGKWHFYMGDSSPPPPNSYYTLIAQPGENGTLSPVLNSF